MQKDTIPLAECPVRATLEVLAGKWKPVILFYLTAGTHRFSELRRRMPDATQKMLTQQLRELEADGIVCRKVHPQVPPKVEYSLTPYGATLKPVLKAICNWGRIHPKRSARTTPRKPTVAK